MAFTIAFNVYIFTLELTKKANSNLELELEDLRKSFSESTTELAIMNAKYKNSQLEQVLEAQLLSHYRCHRLTQSLTISPLFVDRFGHSLQFCFLEFDKAISDVVYRADPPLMPKIVKIKHSISPLFVD